MIDGERKYNPSVEQDDSASERGESDEMNA
jgi:hypothetical protein